MDWTYSRCHYQGKTISTLAQQYLQTLQEIIDFCQASGIRGFTPSDFPLAQLTQAELDRLVQSFGPQPTIASIYPLTPMQQGMLFHSRFAPAEGFYVEQLQLTLQGSVDWGAFHQAWQQLTHHHAILRTCFVETQDQQVQVVLDQVEIPWTTLDWCHLSAEAQQTQLQAWLHHDRQQGFVEPQAPLARFCLMHLDQERYHFVWTYHHALLDGWSMPLLLRDLLAYYGSSAQHKINLAHPRYSFENYIIWLQQQNQAGARVYWQERLAGFLAPIQLPLQNRVSDPLSAAEATYHQHILELAEGFSQSLQAWLQDQHLTLAPLIYGAWGLLLSRYCRESDVVFGVTISGRAIPLAGIEEVVGLCINTLPLRITLADQLSTTRLLQAIQQDLQDLQQQGFLSLAEIQQLSLIPTGQILFETLVVIENYPLDQALQQQSLLPIERITVREHTHYPLTLVALPGESLSFCFSYNSHLFTEAEITGMATHFQNLLQAMINRPSQSVVTLPLLSATEQHQLLRAWNDTAANDPTDLCIHQWFEIQAQKTPDAVALVYEQIQLSYAELNAQANRLARHLQTLGVGPEVLVGLCVERSIEMIVGLLAILKAGGAYVPLDPAYPQERLRLILQDPQLAILISQRPLQARLPHLHDQSICWIDKTEIWANASPENLIHSTNPENLAYVIYTSGSTGQPKGVMVQHRGLINLAQAQIKIFGVSSESRVLQFASINFDASISEIVMALGSGARLCLASPATLLPGDPLIQTLEAQAITHVTLPPSVLAVLPVQDLPDLTTLIVAGEACSADLVAKWGKGRRFFNAYGPTEATVCTTIAVCEQGPPPIGRPIANTQAYILDPHLNPVPVGVPGELHIGGIGLARGYLNRPELTQQKFIPNPFSDLPEARLYKTGDLARYLRDGTIEYLGRMDDQVKIRGYRIEP
ncbi:MAG: amino acid adenylation domain-containing protein, partial [Synechococcaceae cyanobacterium SM2_3_1]|nr:amino acid adenylation domain-containing protein [Synechococcaceae cyanobacterium SM2_3_1]